MTGPPARRIWVDTDCGVDDAVALAVLVSAGADLAGVSSVHGNTGARQAAANAAGVLARLGNDAPVLVDRTPESPGAPSPRHGHDELGGTGWGREDRVSPGDGAGAAAGSDAAILGLGPATTLAAAAADVPAWRSILLVAGVGGPTGDTNTRADPAAMAALLRSAGSRDVAVTVVGPAARWGAALEQRGLTVLRRHAPAWWSLVAGYAESQSATAGRDLLVLHDALAAAVLTRPDLVLTSTRRPVVATPDGLRERTCATAAREAAAGRRPPPPGVDAVVTWVDRLVPDAGDAVLDALLATEDAVATRPQPAFPPRR